MTQGNKAVEEIMATYTPVEVKRLIHDHSNEAFVHHQDTKAVSYTHLTLPTKRIV